MLEWPHTIHHSNRIIAAECKALFISPALEGKRVWMGSWKMHFFGHGKDVLRNHEHREALRARCVNLTWGSPFPSGTLCAALWFDGWCWKLNLWLDDRSTNLGLLFHCVQISYYIFRQTRSLLKQCSLNSSTNCLRVNWLHIKIRIYHKSYYLLNSKNTPRCRSNQISKNSHKLPTQHVLS